MLLSFAVLLMEWRGNVHRIIGSNLVNLTFWPLCPDVPASGSSLPPNSNNENPLLDYMNLGS